MSYISWPDKNGVFVKEGDTVDIPKLRTDNCTVFKAVVNLHELDIHDCAGKVYKHAIDFNSSDIEVTQ